MIQYLLLNTSKLLNTSDITKRIGSFFKLPIQLFYGVPYPELAYIIRLVGGRKMPLSSYVQVCPAMSKFLG